MNTELEKILSDIKAARPEDVDTLLMFIGVMKSGDRITAITIESDKGVPVHVRVSAESSSRTAVMIECGVRSACNFSSGGRFWTAH